MALQRIRIGRALAYLAAVAISVFILAPIYLITISAFSSFDAVYDYPKNLLPTDVSMESMNIFLDSDGVTDSLQRSVYRRRSSRSSRASRSARPRAMRSRDSRSGRPTPSSWRW